jgi:hypothetical protein
LDMSTIIIFRINARLGDEKLDEWASKFGHLTKGVCQIAVER